METVKSAVLFDLLNVKWKLIKDKRINLQGLPIELFQTKIVLSLSFGIGINWFLI